MGPTPESNWVIPGRLLVGAYPASQSDVETFELLISILKQGVTSFVCLQQEVIYPALPLSVYALSLILYVFITYLFFVSAL